MRVLLAPDKFKGSLPAPEVAQALAVGVRRSLPDAEVRMLPLADGGDGTADALVSALGGRIERVRVSGPLGDPVDAPLGWLEDGRAVVEMAAASGLALVDEASRDALRASSRGTGEVIARALEARDLGRTIIVGLGGSASTDGGTGAAAAVGWRFRDGAGRELGPGGGELHKLAAIDGSAVREDLGAGPIVGASDVDNPLLGRRGAARTFAPQKGASPEQVEQLERGLRVLAERIDADLGVEVADRWGGGACGGIGAGLIAFFGARLAPGFDLVAEVTALEEAIAWSDLVITGEGRLDDQSLGGKTPVGVARLARAARVPCVAVAGEVAADRRALEEAGFAQAAALVEAVGRERALTDVRTSLAEVAARLIADEEVAREDTS